MQGGGGSNKEAKRARKDEEERQARIRQGTTRVNSIFDRQFDDDFFGDRRESYVDFARPQLDDQFSDAKEQLIYNLARTGTMGSSTAGTKEADVRKQYDIGLQDITDKGRQYETEARSSVEDARADLVAMLNATGDAEGAANAATSRATALSRTPAYSPLTQLFTDTSSMFAQQAALERAAAAGSPIKPRYNTGLFGPSPNAVKVT